MNYGGLLARPVTSIMRRAKSDDNRDTTTASVTSDYGSGCDVTCDVSSKSRRANHNHCVLDVTNDVTSIRTLLDISPTTVCDRRGYLFNES